MLSRVKLENRPVLLLSLFLVVLVAFSSCSRWNTVALTPNLGKSGCGQSVDQPYTKEDMPKPIHEIALDTLLLQNFSFQSLNIANAIGVLDQLKDLLLLHKSYEEAPDLEKRIDIMAATHRINNTIASSALEITAIASELDCEEERADQIATYLKKKEDNASTLLTVGAIVVGASGAIAVGVLLANGLVGNFPDYIGIGTGLVEAALGILILLNKKKVVYHHPRNALADIWLGTETSKIFPAPVWYYLYYEHNGSDEPSIRIQLIDRWMSFGQIAKIKEKKKEKVYDLLFGEGGKYTAEQLFNRSDMHDQIEAQINLMSRHLRLLSVEIQSLDRG